MYKDYFHLSLLKDGANLVFGCGLRCGEATPSLILLRLGSLGLLAGFGYKGRCVGNLFMGIRCSLCILGCSSGGGRCWWMN